MWVSNEKRYYEKSLRTKRRAEAIDKAEEMYFDLQNELKDGRKLFSVSIADAVAIYLEHRKIDVRTKEIVEGRWVTIRAHLNHSIEYVGENEKAANLGINTLVKFEWKGKETNYVLFRTEQGASKQTVRNEMASINVRHQWEKRDIHRAKSHENNQIHCARLWDIWRHTIPIRALFHHGHRYPNCIASL